MIKSMQNLDDYVRGATLFGTGGGGSETMGKNLLMGSFEEAKEIKFSKLSELDSNHYVCTAFYMGSIAPLSEEDKRQMKKLGLIKKKEERVLIKAVHELERELGIEISGIIPVELGGLNSAAPVDAALKMGKKLIDADLAGRAVPEVAQTLPRIKKIPIVPATCCDAWGNVCVIRETHSYDLTEMLGKMISIPAFEPIGMACFAMKAKEAVNCIYQGSLSRCMEVGAAVREAREKGKDPAVAFAEIAGGKVIFCGEVSEHLWESKGGYMIGTTTINGDGDFKGNKFKVWFKNENHISWFNDRPYITSPDLIQIVDAVSGDPITSAADKPGLKVSVVAIPNVPYQNEEGISLLGPSHFGFDDIPYKRMQDLI